MHQQRHPQDKGSSGTIAKEVLFGLLAIGLGGYNLLSQFGVIPGNFEIPQLIGNGVLVIVGFILLLTAFKLWRYRWHSSRIF